MLHQRGLNKSGQFQNAQIYCAFDFQPDKQQIGYQPVQIWINMAFWEVP
jgi:hypothetical protein